MKTLCWIALVMISTAAVAQKAPVKFGDVSMEELKMTKYDKDTSAAGVILADFGESKVEYAQGKGFYIRFSRVRRVKIFKKDAYSFAEFEIPVYHYDARNEEKLSGLKAVTYNLEGGKKTETKLKDDGIFKEKFDENWNLVKFTLPNVKEGSVLEISYTVISDFIFNLRSWEFQSTIPVKISEYRASIPEYFDYQKYMQGYVQLAVADTKQTSDVIQITTKETTTGRAAQTTFDSDQFNHIRNDHRWVAMDVPAFIVEPQMNNTRDYVSKINFELAAERIPGNPPRNRMNSWESLNQEFLANPYFGRMITGSGFLNSITDDVTAGLSTPIEKTAKIYDYVRRSIVWDGTYRKYVTEDLKKALDLKKGNSADVNLLLIAMLQKAGIQASPVLISTRNHGFIRKQFPLSTQFNYVICAATVADKIILLDGTDRSLPMEVLPERCLNGEGFVVSEKTSGWINVAPTFKSRTVSNFDLVIDQSGELKGMMNISRDGYDAQEMRSAYVSKGEANYLSEVASAKQWELNKSTFENVASLNQSVKESHELNTAQQLQVAGDVIYLNPFVAGRIGDNPFKSETRRYPVDFGSPSEEIIIGKFSIPTGYAVDEMPKPKVVMLPKSGGKYVYSCSLVGDKIQFSSQFSINQSIFTQEEYASLREFYNQVVAKQAEQIVLKKK